MADFRVMKVTVVDRQIVDLADIEIVLLTVAIPVIRELAIINSKTVGRSVSAKQRPRRRVSLLASMLRRAR